MATNSTPWAELQRLAATNKFKGSYLENPSNMPEIQPEYIELARVSRRLRSRTARVKTCFLNHFVVLVLCYHSRAATTRTIGLCAPHSMIRLHMRTAMHRSSTRAKICTDFSSLSEPSLSPTAARELRTVRCHDRVGRLVGQPVHVPPPASPDADAPPPPTQDIRLAGWLSR